MRFGLFTFAVSSFLLLVFLILGRDLIRSWVTSLVYQAYYADPATPFGALFARLAPNAQANPVENYVEKSLKLYSPLVLLYFEIALVFNLLLASLAFPTVFWERRFRPFLAALWRNLRKPAVLWAGLWLGLSTSIRVAGPAAGVLIGGYAISKMRRKALIPLVAYFAIAALITYATWPGLWDFPIFRFIEHLTSVTEFGWKGKVLFQDAYHELNELPRNYLPVLLSLQFTEPVIVLFVLGTLVGAVRLYRGSIDRAAMILLLLWLFTPITLAVIFRPRMYDNFRHFLFVIPPIFVLTGLGLGFLFSRIRSRALSAALLIALVLPGLFWIVRLHPYQYVYYNSLAGGVSGAFRRYELDYWATSYREATDYLNDLAPPNSTVFVWGPAHIVQAYARSDLKVERYNSPFRGENPPDFVVITTRFDKDLEEFTDAREVYRIGRLGALFAVVKQLN